jgi:DNA-directed RNA polymerase specialized sigma24 family protein
MGHGRRAGSRRRAEAQRERLDMTDDAVERFELLYRRHFRAVLRYTLARVEPETAKDATAETFLVAWRRLPDAARSATSSLISAAPSVSALVTRC